MALVPSDSSMLSIIPLSYPLILLPAARITLPLTKEQARTIIAQLHENNDRSQPTKNTLGALPVTPPQSEATDAPIQVAKWGCVARIVRLIRPSPLQQPGQHFIVLQGLNRFQLLEEPVFTREDLSAGLKTVRVAIPPSDLRSHPNPTTIREFKEAAIKLLSRLNKDTSTNSARKEAWLRLTDLMDEIEDERLAWFADVMVGAVAREYNDKLDYLCTPDPETRLTKAIGIFTKQASISEVTTKISTAVSESLSKQQKEFFLRQQLDAIQRELSNLTGDKSGDFNDEERGDADELADLKRKIDAMTEGSEHRRMAVREYRRLKRIPQGSVEQGVIRSYLEWLTAVPWPSAENFISSEASEAMKQPDFLSKARAQLDADHFGLDKIKKRLVEYLAIVRLKHTLAQREAAKTLESTPPSSPSTPSGAAIPAHKRTNTHTRAPILLFVGPPGVGKTSLGQSIALALHRPFARISLGGVRDEAEIRGHRRTYVASGPGAIIQALRRAGRPDPVMLLDEIDKVSGANHNGDPSAALLEVLDPEQNDKFTDHYINVPVDLSQILFICTANTLDTISPPLLDRCEVIQLSGYTYDEKIAIATRWLVPKQLRANGMGEAMVEFEKDALEGIVSGYTREAGVRSLERCVGAVCRAKAVEWGEWMDASHSSSPSGLSSTEVAAWKKVVQKEDLEPILGHPRWEGEEKDREERRGLAWGLVVMGMGEGAVMPVETIAVPGSGQLKLTGSLGDVLKESASLALSWVKTHAYALNITSKPSEDPLAHPDPIDIHLHLPAGAQKKDGPSAGVAMVCAFVSLLTGATVGKNVGMTGEITLRGRVTPVGGIKEKVLGAHRAKMRKVILPAANRQDAEQDIPPEIRKEIELVYVRNLEEALREAFGSQLDWRTGQVESRL